MEAANTGVALESLEYRRCSDTYRARYDQDGAPASMAVVGTVATALGVDPVELEPLHDAVDTDALDRVMRGGDGSVRTSFAFGAHEITVSSDGVVEATPRDAEAPDAPDEGPVDG